MAGARALWVAAGMKHEQFGKPIIAIVNSFTQFVPGHTHLHEIGQIVKKEIEAMGCYAAEFNTIAVDDGIAMGHDGMLYSLPSRDIIADSVEYMVNAHKADAMICISNCDKVTPGMLMASMRLNIPTVFCSGGPMEAGRWKGENADLITAMIKGADTSVSDEEMTQIEQCACPGCGSCSGMFTANSMNSLTEAIGLSLPGNGTILATHKNRIQLFKDAARQVVKNAYAYYQDGDWHRLRFVEKKRDENGVLTHVLCLIRSISDTKKWEHELMYQVEEARKAAALKARFLSNMSHDIRTPMNGIIGTLNLANRYPDDLEVQRKCREQIMTSSKYLVSIVNDILDMNKLESGGVVEQEIPFNLAGNPIYVERLLTNISDNAVKFTGPGGSVRVWCAEKYADEERVVYEFGCADTGIGMSETFLEHAFEPFTQENETSRSRYEGTGLGLAIAKKIVDRLDGDIAIESKKGVGTTVTMTLPFKIGEPVEKEKNVNYEEIPVEGLRALLAEDNELNMEITKFMLEDYGIHVECAADGEEAVQKFKNLSWDITM